MLARIAVCSLLAVASASPALAQAAPALAEDAETVPVVVTKLVLPSADGSQTREYDVSDFAVSLARGMAYGVGDPRGEASVSLSLSGGLDGFLLQWASQATVDTQQARKVTIRSDNPDAPKVYEFEGARVLGLNIGAGSLSMISLQVGLTTLTIDGVRMN